MLRALADHCLKPCFHAIFSLKIKHASKYVFLFQRVLSVSLSRVEKAALNVPNLCVNKTNGGGDLTAHVLVRAFAIGNQVASVYTPRSNSAATLNDLNVRLFAASTTPQSRLESLALLAALLTTWAGNDERKFQSYLNVRLFDFYTNSLHSGDIEVSCLRVYSSNKY